ncbi:unnamed protein product [Cuscuta campestris]|uniref:RNase H type-1 domain-containing protein n=1 Tax=Cuscuta campestris TaxID=132261 RepID=A0A484KAL1_9ASTE|nr:unnamed protein product [Cuscuta campestris]
MESDYFLYDSIIPETEFQDIGVEDEVIHLSSTSDAKEEDEVIVIHSDDDDAGVAPVRDKNVVIVLESEEDSLIGSEEDGSFEDVEGFARQVWTTSILGWYMPHVNDFVAWLEKIFNLFNQRDQALVFHILCSIWKTRNDRVWRGKNSTPIGTWLKAKAHFEEWWSLAPPMAGTPVGVTGSSWSRPRDGFVKVNIDASTGLVDDMMGVGFITRNDLGVFLAAKNKSFRGSYGPREAEAVAVKEALSWIKSKGWMQARFRIVGEVQPTH